MRYILPHKTTEYRQKESCELILARLFLYAKERMIYREKSLDFLWLLGISGRLHCAHDVGFRCWCCRYGRGRMERVVELMKKYVMYEALGTWYITTAENHNRYIEDARQIHNLGRDFE